MNEKPTGIDRRRFVRTAGIGAGFGAAAALAAPAIARAQDKITWKMPIAWPKNTPGVGVNAQRVADMIGSMSDGRLTIQLFGAGELVPPFEVFDAVSTGTAEIGHGTAYFWQGKNPVFHFFTGVPFGLTAQEHAGWLYYGGAQALWEKAYEPFGVLPFYAGSSGPQAGGWFGKEINSLNDLKGFKMRIAGLGGEVMRRLGVNVVLLPPGEIFNALQSGAIDAAEWIGPWNDLAFGLYKVVPYYYLPAFHETGPALEVIVNKAAYEKLPDDLKEIVKRASMASAMESFADFTYHNAEAFGPILEKEGVQPRTWPDDVVVALGAESEKVLAEIGDANPLAKETYDSFVAFRKKASDYAKVSDQRMLEMRSMVLGS